MLAYSIAAVMVWVWVTVGVFALVGHLTAPSITDDSSDTTGNAVTYPWIIEADSLESALNALTGDMVADPVKTIWSPEYAYLG